MTQTTSKNNLINPSLVNCCSLDHVCIFCHGTM